MFNINNYFNGKVTSISGFKALGMDATIGIMQQNEYKFSTNATEYMTVVSGSLTVQLPGSEEWITYVAGETFEITNNSSFQVKADVDSTYLCRYA